MASKSVALGTRLAMDTLIEDTRDGDLPSLPLDALQVGREAQGPHDACDLYRGLICAFGDGPFLLHSSQR
jgi:hypothetical protein